MSGQEAADAQAVRPQHVAAGLRSEVVGLRPEGAGVAVIEEVVREPASLDGGPDRDLEEAR
jgi:hypothetical protein